MLSYIMPKTTMNYSNTILYKIVCNDLLIKDIYVGHTTNFIKRKSQHKKDCSNEKSKSYNIFVYKIIRDNGGWENWCMIEIEKYNCNDVNEARSRERYWIEFLHSNLNKQIPNRTATEYRIENKEQINKYSKEYRIENKEQLADKHKEYYQENKEKIAEYRIENKEKIAEYRSQKIDCECGSCYTKGNKSQHLKTKKHLEMNNI